MRVAIAFPQYSQKTLTHYQTSVEKKKPINSFGEKILFLVLNRERVVLSLDVSGRRDDQMTQESITHHSKAGRIARDAFFLRESMRVSSTSCIIG